MAALKHVHGNACVYLGIWGFEITVDKCHADVVFQKMQKSVADINMVGEYIWKVDVVAFQVIGIVIVCIYGWFVDIQRICYK